MTKKILAIASPGGHWIQLNKICNPLEQQFDVLYVTPAAQYTGNKSTRKIISITDASATSKHKLIPLALQLLWIFIKERPTAIISTGAAPGAIAFLLAKFLPIKTIWVDSIANTTELSRSARMIKKHANLVMTQWDSLQEEGSVVYKGSIL
ncbi:MAG: oligosaccharide biosynthesis protein Alg14 [Cocleimonas sp.]